jgi:hypothetical protein
VDRNGNGKGKGGGSGNGNGGSGDGDGDGDGDGGSGNGKGNGYVLQGGPSLSWENLRAFTSRKIISGAQPKFEYSPNHH